MSQTIGNQMISAALNKLAQEGDTAGTRAGAPDKFQALMDQPHLTPPGGHAGVGGEGTMLSNLVSSHDAAAQDAMRHITEFSQQAGDMDVKQVVAESARAAMEMYQVQFDFQAKMSVVSSSKSSAETLMKNQ
ncbi:type III secretion protein HrpB2 [Caballeronia mineralivorans]|jgi:type III secretion inner rod protein HrpB2|uniref:type III secretion protein HrpB2 n=1 Tax=Caballeronia mineralivorans TaxID=2010198 RepID=UPI0023EFDFAF|nr:type III secretion protein HrpB2 [Caballeronia mineralivorans]MDB5787006.1 type secretion protein [Caballeronia mineralivorans]MEA3098927.1 type secretion inner rod protein HrpB2 [Caballeronia mineralivorans]